MKYSTLGFNHTQKTNSSNKNTYSGVSIVLFGFSFRGACAHKHVVVDWSPHVHAFLGRLQLDTVGVAVRVAGIPGANDFAVAVTVSQVGLDKVADLEAKGLGHHTVHEPLSKFLFIDVFANKHETVLPLLTRFPLGLRKISAEKHVHALENEFLLHAFDRQDTLVAV